MKQIFRNCHVRPPKHGEEDFWYAHERVLKKNKVLGDKLHKYAQQWDKAFARLQKWENYLPPDEYFDLNQLQIVKAKMPKLNKKDWIKYIKKARN